MTGVRRKLESRVVEDPLGRPAADDPWAAFREIEFLDFPLEFRFRHSLGKLSRFFLALEQRRLLATRCPRCGDVWMPPRAVCPNDLEVTHWHEVPGRGTLEAAALSAYTTKTDGGSDELVLGYVALEGTSTLLLQQIRGYGDPERLVAGLPVRVAWSDAPVDHPMELFWFEPAR
jgi:uncharacterized OB-fold protein